MFVSKIVGSFFLVSLLIACGSGDSGTDSKAGTLNAGDTIALSHHSEFKDTGNHSAMTLTAGEVLSRLKAGNRNFVKKLSPNNISHDTSYNYFEQIAHTRSEQHPIACILTCMDSRVPPEIIFDQGIGSLFVVRIAGNIEDPDILGSMEYAVAEKGVKLIIVMGHKNCGAINAAFAKLDPENKELVSLIEHIKMDVVPNDRPPYDASARHHVKKTIENILNGSKTIREKLLAGELILVGALYDVADGRVDWNSSNW